MFKRLLMRLLRNQILDELKQAYEAGVSTGYNLGFRLGRREKDNRGFITGSRMDRELEEILKEEE